jgi:hypothetical protein
VGPAVVSEKQNFRLRQSYAETRWRGKMRKSEKHMLKAKSSGLNLNLNLSLSLNF